MMVVGERINARRTKARGAIAQAETGQANADWIAFRQLSPGLAQLIRSHHELRWPAPAVDSASETAIEMPLRKILVHRMEQWM